jgi:hypothetical protein
MQALLIFTYQKVKIFLSLFDPLTILVLIFVLEFVISRFIED